MAVLLLNYSRIIKTSMKSTSSWSKCRISHLFCSPLFLSSSLTFFFFLYFSRGYNIGIRLIEELLSVSGLGRCPDLAETAEVIARVGFKMFLGVSGTVTNWSSDGNTFSIILEDNPLTDFVELPEQYAGLQYSNIFCGIINGALEMVQFSVESQIIKSPLQGDEHLEIRVLFRKLLQDDIPVG